jgi:hypothetical protein
MMNDSLQPTMLRRVSVRQLTGSDTLVGKTDGQRDAPKFVNLVFGDDREETLLWDWSGIEVATASYFATTITPLMRMITSGELAKYFLFTRLNKNCLDELSLVLNAEGLVAMMVHMKGEKVASVDLVGKLDPVYANTFREVIRRGAISAAELFKHSQHRGKSQIGKTAWVNRLTGLNRLRLLRKEKVGREFVFHVPFLEV